MGIAAARGGITRDGTVRARQRGHWQMRLVRRRTRRNGAIPSRNGEAAEREKHSPGRASHRGAQRMNQAATQRNASSEDARVAAADRSHADCTAIHHRSVDGGSRQPNQSQQNPGIHKARAMKFTLVGVPRVCRYPHGHRSRYRFDRESHRRRHERPRIAPTRAASKLMPGIKPKAALPKVTTHDTGSRGDGSLRVPADGPLQRSTREDVVNVVGATQRCRGRERRSTRRHPAATLPSREPHEKFSVEKVECTRSYIIHNTAGFTANGSSHESSPSVPPSPPSVPKRE